MRARRQRLTRISLGAILSAGLVLGLLGAPAAIQAQAGPADETRPETLRTDFRTDPLGIDNRTPSLSWTTAPDGRGQTQTAYQVRVASAPNRLARADLWDSGKVGSAEQVGITYAGAALQSRQQAYWQVRTWDRGGLVSEWSRVARWEMGLLDKGDWDAGWIGNREFDPAEPQPVTVPVPAQDARYVRIDVSRLGLPLKEGFPKPVSRLQLAEISVADGDTVVSRGAAVTASEAYVAAGSWEPRFVTDGSLTTQSAPLGYTSYERENPDLGDAPIWLRLDLGAVKHFDRVLLYPRTDTLTVDGKTANFPVDFRIGTSPDGTAYTTGADVTGQAPPAPLKPEPATMPLFARQFSVDKPVRSARLYATGLGINVATVNGKPAGSSVLDPANTDYKQRVEYATYDVTSLIRKGGNAVGVQLGNGNFNVPPTPGRYEKFVGSQGKPKMLAQLEITYADGSRQVVASDTSWRTTLGATTFSNWYGGEDYDARRAQPGWDAPGGDLSGWEPSVDVAAPAETTVLGARSAPPIEIVEKIPTRRITQPKPGVYVVDLGVNFAGWPQLAAQGPAGTAITMRPAEQLAADGTVTQHTTGSPIWDTFTLAGTGKIETWHPQFSYHGFRYLQLEGMPSAPKAGTVTGLSLRAANERAGSFDSSNVLLNKVHTIIDRAIQSNMYSVLTDCPHREKLGWLEEYHLVFGSISRNYDVAAYYRTLVRTIAEAQTPDGLVPDIAPEYTVFSGGFRDDPNWGGAIVLAPWELYRTYGDIGLLRTYYPSMVKYLDYLAGKADGDILAYGLGDWIAFDQTTPLGVTATFAYHRLAAAMARIAAVIGNDADAARWTALTERIGAAFNREFHHGNTYGSGSQASDAFALDLGIVPAEQREAVLDHLVDSIESKGWHLTVGEIALPSVFRALSAAGRDDVIYKIATQTGNPSYGYQVTHGATSLTENWDGPTSGNSQNHFMLGAIDEWFTSGLAGIRQSADSIGYRKLEIRPSVVGDLAHAAGTLRTPYGEVRSSWQRTGTSLTLDLTVPPGSTAEVWVPGANATGSDGAEPVRTENGATLFEVGSGTWRFTAELDGTVPPVTGQLGVSAPESAAVVTGTTSTMTVALDNITDKPLKVQPVLTASAGYTATAPASVTIPANGHADLEVTLGHPGTGTEDGSLEIEVAGQHATVALSVTDNLARAATMTASSSYGRFSPAAAADGDIRGQTDFGVWNGGSGWNDNTAGAFPDTLTATWPQPVTVGRVRLRTLDAAAYPASRFGLRDYDLEAQVGGTWTTVGSVRGNTAGTVDTAFTPVAATALRLKVLDTNDHSFSRVAELEVRP